MIFISEVLIFFHFRSANRLFFILIFTRFFMYFSYAKLALFLFHFRLTISSY